jgi:hypothetical protein
LTNLEVKYKNKIERKEKLEAAFELRRKARKENLKFGNVEQNKAALFGRLNLNKDKNNVDEPSDSDFSSVSSNLLPTGRSYSESPTPTEHEENEKSEGFVEGLSFDSTSLISRSNGDGDRRRMVHTKRRMLLKKEREKLNEIIEEEKKEKENDEEDKIERFLDEDEEGMETISLKLRDEDRKEQKDEKGKNLSEKEKNLSEKDETDVDSENDVGMIKSQSNKRDKEKEDEKTIKEEESKIFKEKEELKKNLEIEEKIRIKEKEREIAKLEREKERQKRKMERKKQKELELKEKKRRHKEENIEKKRLKEIEREEENVRKENERIREKERMEENERQLMIFENTEKEKREEIKREYDKERLNEKELEKAKMLKKASGFFVTHKFKTHHRNSVNNDMDNDHSSSKSTFHVGMDSKTNVGVYEPNNPSLIHTENKEEYYYKIFRENLDPLEEESILEENYEEFFPKKSPFFRFFDWMRRHNSFTNVFSLIIILMIICFILSFMVAFFLFIGGRLLSVRTELAPLMYSQRINIGGSNSDALVNIGTNRLSVSSTYGKESILNTKKITRMKNDNQHNFNSNGESFKMKNSSFHIKTNQSLTYLKTSLSSDYSESRPLLFVGPIHVDDNGNEQHIIEVWDEAVYMKELHVAKVEAP